MNKPSEEQVKTNEENDGKAALPEAGNEKLSPEPVKAKGAAGKEEPEDLVEEDLAGPRKRQGQKRKKFVPDEQASPEFVEKVIAINRITKVTKGGKKLSFRALVVVGDMKGKVGYSLSKASEVAIAIRKAMGNAKKNMVQIPMRGATIPHEIIGECGGAAVLLKPASEGTGVIASGPVRAVCDGAGIHDILTKCHRSNNPINVVKATFDGLTRLKRPVSVVAETVR